MKQKRLASEIPAVNITQAEKKFQNIWQEAKKWGKRLLFVVGISGALVACKDDVQPPQPKVDPPTEDTTKQKEHTYGVRIVSGNHKEIGAAGEHLWEAYHLKTNQPENIDGITNADPELFDFDPNGNRIWRTEAADGKGVHQSKADDKNAKGYNVDVIVNGDTISAPTIDLADVEDGYLRTGDSTLNPLNTDKVFAREYQEYGDSSEHQPIDGTKHSRYMEDKLFDWEGFHYGIAEKNLEKFYDEKLFKEYTSSGGGVIDELIRISPHVHWNGNKTALVFPSKNLSVHINTLNLTPILTRTIMGVSHLSGENSTDGDISEWFFSSSGGKPKVLDAFKLLDTDSNFDPRKRADVIKAAMAGVQANPKP